MEVGPPPSACPPGAPHQLRCRCIPVIIIDGVEQIWHSIMDIGSYSLRVPHKDMAHIPEILKAVSPEDVARMQSNVGKVWRRYIWTGHRAYGQMAREMIRSRRNATLQVG